jgi:hypothetical protein
MAINLCYKHRSAHHAERVFTSRTLVTAHYGAHKEASQVVYMMEIYTEGYPIPALNRPNRVSHRNSTVPTPIRSAYLNVKTETHEDPLYTVVILYHT